MQQSHKINLVVLKLVHTPLPFQLGYACMYLCTACARATQCKPTLWLTHAAWRRHATRRDLLYHMAVALISFYVTVRQLLQKYCNRLDRKLTFPQLGTLKHLAPGLQLCWSTWTCWQGMPLMLLAQAVVKEYLQRPHQVYIPLLCCHPGLRQGSLNSLLASLTICQLHLVNQSAKSGEHCRWRSSTYQTATKR